MHFEVIWKNILPMTVYIIFLVRISKIFKLTVNCFPVGCGFHILAPKFLAFIKPSVKQLINWYTHEKDPFYRRVTVNYFHKNKKVLKTFLISSTGYLIKHIPQFITHYPHGSVPDFLLLSSSFIHLLIYQFNHSPLSNPTLSAVPSPQATGRDQFVAY